MKLLGRLLRELQELEDEKPALLRCAIDFRRLRKYLTNKRYHDRFKQHLKSLRQPLSDAGELSDGKDGGSPWTAHARPASRPGAKLAPCSDLSSLAEHIQNLLSCAPNSAYPLEHFLVFYSLTAPTTRTITAPFLQSLEDIFEGLARGVQASGNTLDSVDLQKCELLACGWITQVFRARHLKDEFQRLYSECITACQKKGVSFIYNKGCGWSVTFDFEGTEQSFNLYKNVRPGEFLTALSSKQCVNRVPACLQIPLMADLKQRAANAEGDQLCAWCVLWRAFVYLCFLALAKSCESSGEPGGHKADSTVGGGSAGAADSSGSSDSEGGGDALMRLLRAHEEEEAADSRAAGLAEGRPAREGGVLQDGLALPQASESA